SNALSTTGRPWNSDLCGRPGQLRQGIAPLPGNRYKSIRREEVARSTFGKVHCWTMLNARCERLGSVAAIGPQNKRRQPSFPVYSEHAPPLRGNLSPEI